MPANVLDLDLGDLELALLVAAVAGEHCIFSTSSSPHALPSLRAELRATCEQRFRWRPAVVDCKPDTTADHFADALLVPADPPAGPAEAHLDVRRVADVVLAVALDTAADAVQLQALELLRSRRIFTRSAVHPAPKHLLFVAVVSARGARLTRHLHDLFCISHHHPPDPHGVPHLPRPVDPAAPPPVPVTADDIRHLRDRARDVRLAPDVAQYLHDVVLFLRNSRFVAGGVTAAATRQLRSLSVALAPLHGLDYVPPSLVALAARKVYPHRLRLATETTERSVRWGSDPRAVRELMAGVTVDRAIEHVLASVHAPL